MDGWMENSPKDLSEEICSDCVFKLKGWMYCINLCINGFTNGRIGQS